MPTNWTGRTPVTTSWNGRPTISGFQSYTWATAPDTWASVTANWDNYGIISSGTVLTGRIIPT